jgi:hypothetical protein
MSSPSPAFPSRLVLSSTMPLINKAVNSYKKIP